MEFQNVSVLLSAQEL